MKYVNTAVVFQEVYDEITLAISISNCPFRCKGCHSPELWEDNGTPLTIESLEKLIELNNGITCVCFMGGTYSKVKVLAEWIKNHFHYLKTAWYTGQDLVETEVNAMTEFDFVKIGHYDEKLGGLDHKTTNQKFFERIDNKFVDTTFKFWK